MFNPSRCQVFSWPDLIGFHMNACKSDLTPAMEAARVYPTSPNVVWAGDPGVPAKVPTDYQMDGTYRSIPNPDLKPNSPKHETVFLLFVDEAEARALAPHLWVEAPAA